jgi:hypothetical protein
MSAVDTFSWKMRNVDGVQEVVSLPIVAKIADRRLERRQFEVAQHPARAEPAGAVDALHRDQLRAAERDCNVAPVMIFLRDHKAGTIERVVAAVQGMARGEHARHMPRSTSPPATWA